MKVAFVDKLSKSLSESEHWQAAKTRGEILFLFLEEIGKRNEISSRALKNMHISQLREDEKKDEEVYNKDLDDPEGFVIDVIDDLLRELNGAKPKVYAAMSYREFTPADEALDTLNEIKDYLLEKQQDQRRKRKRKLERNWRAQDRSKWWCSEYWPFGYRIYDEYDSLFLWLLVIYPLKYELMT